MSLFSGISKIIAGAALIAGALALDAATGGAATPFASALITAGAGMIVSGVGTLIAGDGPAKGIATTTRNSVAPWKVDYGRCRTGGTLVYLNMWGSANKVLDMVIVLNAHQSLSVDELLFDQQRIQIDSAAAPPGAVNAGTSFTPVQQTVNLTSIVRDVNGVVTVTVPSDIPYLVAGDQIIIQNVTTDPTLNGTFSVAEIVDAPSSHVGGVVGTGTLPLVFTYLNGGSYHSTISSQGQAKTKWADYGRTVYVEALLGNQALGQTFKGMQSPGTPWLGTGPNVRPEAPGPAGTGGPGPSTILGGTINPWTTSCSLVGKTAVFLRLTFDSKFYASGIPQISFHIHGKNDIFDPRTNSAGYTENAALCIADFLNQGDTTDGRGRIPWGFKAAYGDGGEIPLTTIPGLENAAFICDQAVALARGGTEPRYTCNGQFDLTMGRGEILRNMLTSCAGKLNYVGGQFFIMPGYWTGGGAPAVDLKAIAAGPVKWKPGPTVTDLYNGVKGTYISPNNKWQSTDFPYYAQDSVHGYSGPSDFGGDQNLANDGGDRRWLDIQLPFTISSSMAQRIAKIELLRRRSWGTATFSVNMAGYQFIPLDIISATHSALNWSGKSVEISGTRFRLDRQSMGTGQDAFALGFDIDVQETDAAVYQWSTEEELSPQGYQEMTAPTWSGAPAIANETFPFPWGPGYALPLAGDALYPHGDTKGPASFGIQPVYGVDANGGPQLNLNIKGAPPISNLDEDIAPAILSAAAGTAGSLPQGRYIVGFTPFDASGSPYKNAPFFNLVTLDIPSGGNGSIDVTVSYGSGDVGGDLYVAIATERPIGSGTWYQGAFYFSQSIAPSVTAATITTFAQASSGGPDPDFDHLSILWQQEIHGGCWAQQVQAVTVNTITIADPPGGSGMTSDQWAGYTLSLLAKYDPSPTNTAPGQFLGQELPILHMAVAGNYPSTSGAFVITIGPNSASVSLPDLTTLLAVGDVVLMRFNPTFTASSFSDPNIANEYYPGGDTAIEAGHIARVLTGPDAGDEKVITGVTSGTTVEIAGTWDITPSTGDIVVVLAPALAPPVPTRNFQIPNKAAFSGTVASPEVSNLASQTWFFTGRTETTGGARGPDAVAPYREVYLFGAQGTRVVTGNSSENGHDSTLLFDTSGITGSTDTLGAAITDTTGTSITVSSGSDMVAGTVIQIGSEKMMLVVATSGTTVWTVVRGSDNTTAATHSNGATVNVPGALTFALLPISQIPNVELTLTKTSSDINYVLYQVAGSTSDTLPGGGTSGILPDNSPDLGTVVFLAPGA